MRPVTADITRLIGRTPLIEIKALSELTGATLLAKLESFNPLGSVKDRLALALIEDGEASGYLKRGATVIEATSGNTGIGLAWICATRGYRLILTMPDSMSIERQRILNTLGAELVLTPAHLGMAGSVQKADELAHNRPGAWQPRQFENPANPSYHQTHTGPEIWEQTRGAVDFIVAGVGTGGTLTGVSRYLKSQNAAIQSIAAEPAASPVLSGGCAGPHGIQGIGAGFIPKTADISLFDEIIPVTDENAVTQTRRLAGEFGLLCGISSGAALNAALEVASRRENRGKTIVVIFPDTGQRYLSSPVFQEDS